jgi:hypothetical protein
MYFQASSFMQSLYFVKGHFTVASAQARLLFTVDLIISQKNFFTKKTPLSGVKEKIKIKEN